MPVPKELLAQVKHLIPPMNGSLHKGQSGRVGVLGGAMDYTGAPFFASMSSMRLGVDLAHAICSPTAGNAMKTYAPDLIVHPILREDAKESDIRTQLEGIMDRLHVLVVGPGLGREDYMQKYAKLAVTIAREKAMYVVVDADGLWMVGHNLDLVKGYRRAVLTPNVVEFKRLSEAVSIDPKAPANKRASLVSKALGGVLVVQKGETDYIATNTTGSAADPAASHVPEGENEAIEEVVEIDVPGGLKRCGGQGDILSGTIGGFLAWGKCLEDGAWGKLEFPTSRIPILAASGGSMVTRTASRIAFARQGRSVVTADMLGDIAQAFAEVFGEENQGRDLKQTSKI